MRKILVLIPHGEVYDHDCVRAYDHRLIERTVKKYYNMGDLFVFDSSLKLLEFESVEGMVISELSDAKIDRYNAEFDYCFLRGSNYLHPHMDWEHAVPVLEKLKIPVIAFGIGAQSPVRGTLELSETTKRVMRLISEKSAMVGVRGAYTADVLRGIGVSNVEIIGCPTLFRHNNPTLAVALPPLDAISKVAYSLRREVDANYASNIENYFAVQRRMILDCHARFDLTLMAQGEVEEKIIYYRYQQEMASALQNLVTMGWLTGEDDPLYRIYLQRMFYAETVSDYDRFVRTQDLVLGYRLHGNLIALSNGVPSIYCTYDSRTREFAETFRIPSYDIDSDAPFRLEDYYQQSRFDAFNARYREMYGVMSRFLTANGMAHKMAPQNQARPVSSGSR